MAPFLSGLTQQEERVDEVLGQLEMTDKKLAHIHELSLGQVQRVAIARAVMNKPLIVLADEPTSALDDENCERVIQLLFKIVAENQTTLIIATHDQRLKSRMDTIISL